MCGSVVPAGATFCFGARNTHASWVWWCASVGCAVAECSVMMLAGEAHPFVVGLPHLRGSWCAHVNVPRVSSVIRSLARGFSNLADRALLCHQRTAFVLCHCFIFIPFVFVHCFLVSFQTEK